jgi:GxxExxY protein
MHADGTGLNDLSGRVIGCAFSKLNTPGAGFAKQVHENALAIEIRAAGRTVARQCGVTLHYDDMVAGRYFPDLWVEDVLLVELKTVKEPDDAHMPPGT